jgi:hypothetical protein
MRGIAPGDASIPALPKVALFAISARNMSKGSPMADHSPTKQVELGAEMDYQEHEKTYKAFLGLAKYGSLVVVALLIAMAFGFFVTGAGFFSATILFILVCAVGYFLLP